MPHMSQFRKSHPRQSILLLAILILLTTIASNRCAAARAKSQNKPLNVVFLLVDDLGCDSLDIVEIVMASEEEFGVCISDDEADKANTVREAINIIDAKLPEVAA